MSNNTTLPNSFTLRFTNPAPFGTADSVYLFDSGAEPIPTTIITTQVNGVSYEQILQSQNGAVYQVNGLTINIVSAPNDGAKASQLLKPFIFKKRDVNGNELRIEKFQTIDPYQFQFSYSFVDLVDDGEVFVLDGNTEFRYEIEPFVAVNVTFNYVEVRNSTFGTEEGQAEIEANLRKDNELQEESEYANELTLDVDKDNAVATKNKKRSHSWLWWILGGTAVYLLFNSKSNQKK
jgi:hypothetical protein